MIALRQSWQPLVFVLLSIPLWQGGVRFLSIDQGIAAPPVRHDKSFALEGITFTQATQGVKDVTLRAKRLHGTSDNATITLEEINVNRLGDHPFHIASGSAAYDPGREVVTLMDEVLMEADNLTIKTPFLRYLVKHETIKSAAEVSISGKQMALSGTSFMYNLKTRAMRVGERVHFSYTPVQP